MNRGFNPRGLAMPRLVPGRKMVRDVLGSAGLNQISFSAWLGREIFGDEGEIEEC
jgi:hypothetical protein